MKQNHTSTAVETVTVLTCKTPNAKLTKEFMAQADGSITKQSYGAGKFFAYEEKPVVNLADMHALLGELQKQPLSCIIRGKPKANAGAIVPRKLHGDEAAFEAHPRYWVMLDFDKMVCPAYLNPATAPDDVAEWVKQRLPQPFNTASCIYKFSSSQNVPKKAGEDAPNTVSIHFVFWLNRPASEAELKAFFKANPCGVDTALFSAVQIHYTASPIFFNMDDPLPQRMGRLKGDLDTVVMPIVPLQAMQKPTVIRATVPTVSQDKLDEAMALLLAHYPHAGGRDRFCGAVAGMMYRGGWTSEDTAEFIMLLAESAVDDESMKRYDTALRICDAVTYGRPAQGIPVLRNEYNVDNLDEIAALLGVGKPDISAAIAKLSSASSAADVEAVVALLTPLSLAEREMKLEQIKSQTKMGKTILNKILRNALQSCRDELSPDKAVVLMEALLSEYYQGGQYLLRTAGQFWHYNGRYWEVTPDDLLKQRLLLLAHNVADESDRVSGLISSAMSLLEGRVFAKGDLLRFSSPPPMVINCLNGELWFDARGKVTFKPHRAESYLRHCTQAEYNPTASSPNYDAAMLGIFRNSSNPSDMYRHAMELLGYLCQPWRKHAIIVLLYGGGHNGKTSLTTITTHLLGQSSIMACRVSDIEKSAFKIGALANKLILLDDDVDAGTLLPDGFLKKISEEKMMTGEHKHRDPFEFICRAVPVMLGNDYPSIKDVSFGMERRLHVVPFARRFTPQEAKVGLFDTLWQEEASGILNQVIAGFQRLKQRGKFLEPEDCLKAKKEWLVRSNALATFIADMCEEGETVKQRMDEFYVAFSQYCQSAGIRNVPTRPGIRKRLEGMGYGFGMLDGYDVVKGLYAYKDTGLRESAIRFTLPEVTKVGNSPNVL
jgi:P4 family phage/plasmid primase-like protien